ncbi:hypothetical protein ABW02_01930 [Niallia circulans]|uniref:Uncharacterized protein n=1 Tax=Niallia circulans TaxID=1397 RepID=A0A0J1IRD4_NIACI|nr:hypothetical protein [Niallia circulans]KLV28517.1 hypothetical protein ABW02_01930 [Niallia circulans]
MNTQNRALDRHIGPVGPIGAVGPVGAGGFAGVGHGAVGIGAIPLGAVTPSASFAGGNPLFYTPFHHSPAIQHHWNYGQHFPSYSQPYGYNPAYSTYGYYPYY